MKGKAKNKRVQAILTPGAYWICPCGQNNAYGLKKCPKCGFTKNEENNNHKFCDAESEPAQFEALVREGAVAEAVPGFAGRLRVAITRIGRRKLDDDNFVGGCKQLRDAIAEWLGRKGDAEEDGLEFVYRQKHGKTEATIIEIGD